MYDHFKSQDEAFVKARHKGKLSRFKLRNIYAIDSTTIKLAYWCFKELKQTLQLQDFFGENDVCKVYGIAECRFQGNPRESPKSINTRV